MTFYTKSQRDLQDQFESRPLADVIEATVVAEVLDERQITFIRSRDFFFLSTVNADGEPTVSHKGGDIGTVQVLNEKTLAFPAYDGNGMFLSMGNIAETAKIGLLFIDFETPNRVRVQATATFHIDDPLLADYPGAVGIVRARVDKAFVNCARYIHKHQRQSTSPYVPQHDGAQPVPSWKRIDGLHNHLHPSDQAKVVAAGGTITPEEYAEAFAKGES